MSILTKFRKLADDTAEVKKAVQRLERKLRG